MGSTVIRVSRCPRQSCWLPQHTRRACRTTDRTRCHDLWTASRSALSRAGCRRSASAGHDCSSESYRRSRFRHRAGRESERGMSRSCLRIGLVAVHVASCQLHDDVICQPRALCYAILMSYLMGFICMYCFQRSRQLYLIIVN